MSKKKIAAVLAALLALLAAAQQFVNSLPDAPAPAPAAQHADAGVQ